MDEQAEHRTETPNKKPLLLPAVTGKFSWIKQFFGKKWIKLGVMAIVAVPLVGLLAWWGWSNSSLSKLGVDAALVEGVAEYRLGDGQPWEKIQEGMSFGEGAQIRTTAGSRAALNIDDGSAVRLNGGSSVVLAKLTANQIIIQNTGGDVYARVAKSNKRTFLVKSGTATYQSGGTAYRTLNTAEKEGVEVYHSQVSILGLKAAGAIPVGQGERYYVVNAAATYTEGKATELSREALAAYEFVQWNSELDKKDFGQELGVLADLSPPALEVTAPANGLITDTSNIEVRGTTEKGAKVLVNGTAVENQDGQFATYVNLNEGANEIKVEASDAAGNKAIKALTITLSPEPAGEAPNPSSILDQ